MFIVEITPKQTIERALKVLKRKWDKNKVSKELRDRKEFTKKSVKRREQLKKAAYIEQKYRTNN